MKKTIKELLDEYIKAKSIHLKENTMINIKNNLNKYLYLYLSSINITNLNRMQPEDINNYYNYITSLSLKPQSINLVLKMILNFIEWLDILEYINPKINRKFKQIFNKIKENYNFKNNYLNNNEIDLLLNSFDQNNKSDWYYRFAIITLIYTGLRRGELYGLTWDDIDFTNNTIKVNKQYSIQFGKLLDYTKTNNERIIYIPKWLTNYFKKYKLISNNNYIFNHRNLNKKLTNACKKANIKIIKLHDLRHTYCTMLYSNHIDGKYIQLQMGHKLESTSLNIYKHLDDDMLKEGIKLINNFKAK